MTDVLPVELTDGVQAPPLVVGLDLSLTASGIAWPDGHTISYGLPGLTVDSQPLGQRGQALKTLVVNLGNRILEYAGTPALALLEELPRVHLDSERSYVWWSVVNLLHGRGVHCAKVQPSQLKKYALGKGSGPGIGKGAVIEAVTRRLPSFSTAGDDNRADAAVLCAMARDIVGFPLAPMPAGHREVLDKIKFLGEWSR